jgi:hypothetical protein
MDAITQTSLNRQKVHMAVAVAIVLADAQGTPVNHTFIPLGPDKKGVFWFEDQSQASPIGYWKISMEMIRPPQGVGAGSNSSNRMGRIKIGLHEPVLENITNSTVSGVAPAPTVSYIPRSFTEYVIPERSALLDRQNLRKMNYNLQNNAQVIAVVETLASLW